MSTQIIVALITGAAALVVAITSVPVNYWLTRRSRHEDAMDVMAKYRDPLLWAVHDLHRRLRAILVDDFLLRFLVNGDDDLQVYARRHTMFALAEYLGWVEIVRRCVGFLDLGDHKHNQLLVVHLSTIRRALYAADLLPALYLPVGYQRAIGELMIVQDPTPDGRGWLCIGFAEFCERLDADERFSAWFRRLETSITDFAYAAESDGSDRLVELDRHLMAFIDFLDPTNVRFPQWEQERPRYLSANPTEGVA
jgi:hypothetical protein